MLSPQLTDSETPSSATATRHPPPPGLRTTMEAELVGDLHSVPSLICILSSVLEKVSERNDTAPRAAGLLRVSAFHGPAKPSISVPSYLERIFRYAGCSPSCYVVAYIYLDRFARRHPATPINSFNVHRFLITSVLTAVKFMDDVYYNNAYFAKVGGISLMEMNYLEVKFLFGVGFDLNVTPAAFSSYCSILQREMQLESPPLPPRLHCFLTEEDSGGVHHQQLTV